MTVLASIHIYRHYLPTNVYAFPSPPTPDRLCRFSTNALPSLYKPTPSLSAVSHLIASLILALASVYAAQEMHLGLLTYVLRWPMELFDTTPTGRIINRFAKDVDVVDNILPAVIRSWIFMFFGVMAQETDERCVGALPF